MIKKGMSVDPKGNISDTSHYVPVSPKFVKELNVTPNEGIMLLDIIPRDEEKVGNIIIPVGADAGLMKGIVTAKDPEITKYNIGDVLAVRPPRDFNSEFCTINGTPYYICFKGNVIYKLDGATYPLQKDYVPPVEDVTDHETQPEDSGLKIVSNN